MSKYRVLGAVLLVVVTEVYVVFVRVVNVEVTVVLVVDVTVVVTIAVVVCAWSTDSVEEISRAEARPTKTSSKQSAINLLLAKLHLSTCGPVAF